MRHPNIKLKIVYTLLLFLVACDPGSPTEPAAIYASDVLEPTVERANYGITEGSHADVVIHLKKKTKVRAFVNWEIRGGIGRFLRPTGVVPIDPNVDSFSLVLETFKNERIEAPTDFEVIINSDAFLEPVSTLISVTDLTLPALIQITSSDPFALPTSGVNIPVSGVITLRNIGEVSARSLVPSLFVNPQIYFKGGNYPGTGGTCTSIVPVGSSCTVVVEATMTAAGSITDTLTFTYDSGLATQTKSIEIRAASDSVIATLSGMPNSISKDTALNISVGGVGITTYKYKVGSGSSDCSDPTGYLTPSTPSTSTQLKASLTGIPDGAMRLCVVGINGAAQQQLFAAASVYNWFKDTTPPEMQGTSPNYTGTLVINEGALRTKTLQVNLGLNTSGSQFMYLTNTAGCNSGGTWEIYSNAKAWTLNFANNTNRVYAKFRDSLGNETSCINTPITHDDTPPTVEINQDVNQADPTLVAPVTFIANFSEEIIPGTFTPQAIEQTGSANGINWAITKMTATQYKLEATSVEVGGTIVPAIKADQITDLAGNYSSASTSFDASVTYNLIEFYFKSMHLGFDASCGLANDDKLYCWGSNANNQLGFGPEGSSPLGFIKPELLVHQTLPLVRFRKIDIGTTSSCGIGDDDKLYCWGSSANYLSGQYTSTSPYPAISAETPKIVMIDIYSVTPSCVSVSLPTTSTRFFDVSVGATHACAIDSNFRVNCWGNIPRNANNPHYSIPNCVQPNYDMPGGKKIKQISSGTFGTCALSVTGKVYCFGHNEHGQVGDGTFTPRPAFTALKINLLTNFDGFRQISSGENHTCGVGVNGNVYCWGRGLEGQLGQGAFSDSNAPLLVDTSSLGAVSFQEVKVGLRHSCARTSQSRVYCWGEGLNGKLGNGASANQATPQLVSTAIGTLENLVSLETGAHHTCALSATGKMFCWGLQSTEGRLGNNSATESSRPVLVDVAGLLSKKSLIALSAGSDNTCGVGSDARLSCWGAGSTAKLGDGITDKLRPNPVNVSLIGSPLFLQVSTGRSHSCGLTTIGQAYCWGQNNEGQLGDGSTITSPIPVLVDVNVTGLNDPATPENEFLGFISISVGHSHTCALHANGKAFCWGYGLFGQLGSASILSLSRPQMVNTSSAGIARFAQIDAGDHHTCGVTAEGKAYCWGWGSLGRIGDNSTTDRLVPVLVNTTLNTDITNNPSDAFESISAGSEHTCARTIGQKMYCWGIGTDGRLGNFDGTNSTKLTPATVDVTGIGTFVSIQQIDAGKEHSCLSTNAGKVACWGTGTKGRVGGRDVNGNGDFLSKSRPNPLSFSGAATEVGAFFVTAGGAHSCALGILGDQYCWGEGLNGRLGNNAIENQGVPVNILFP